MKTATLKVEPLGAGNYLVVIDCRHTESSAMYIPSPGSGVTLETVKDVLLASRRLQAPCRCVERLALARQAQANRN